MDTYAVVLYFDPVTDDTLKKIIKDIAEISNNNYMVDVNIPPHITIGSFLSDGSDGLIGIIENFAKSIETFEVKFDGIGVFEPRVLYASPIKSGYLAHLNERINEVLLKQLQPADNGYYTPEKWIPHCALVVRLDERQFQKAKTIEEKIELPMIAKVQKVALAKCNPYKEIEVWGIS